MTDVSIGIDYTPAYEQGGGIGRYVRELTAALARRDDPLRYRLFIAGARADKPLPRFDARFTLRPTPITPSWWARIWQRAGVPLPIEAVIGRVALYHATDFVLPPTLPATPTILTVHDLSFVRVPEAASPRLKAYLDQVVPRSVRRVDHVLADSTATKQDLIEIYGTPPEKITVLLSGVEPTFQPVRSAEARAAARARYGLPSRPYIFSVGTVQPRKNYARLIAALAVLRQRGHDVDLAIAGGKGWLDDPIYAAIRAHHVEDHVHFLGFVADADLPALYSGAVLTALPSLYEGFGIPVLESMACGTPVLTSSISSLPEVAGDAAVLVDPTDLEAIIDGLERLLLDHELRRQLTELGLARATLFTWDSAANLLLQVYRRWI
ncbi:MAG: glycosyltransferase family 4 protein [Candidatus Flexifilum sp.]